MIVRPAVPCAHSDPCWNKLTFLDTVPPLLKINLPNLLALLFELSDNVTQENGVRPELAYS